MSQLYMRLDIGFTTDDLSAVSRKVEQWLGIMLESDDDLELGGRYFHYFPNPIPEVGVCGVRIRQNYVEGLGWRLKYRHDLPICAEVEACGPDLLVLGQIASRVLSIYGDRVSVAAYVVTRSPFNAEDPVFPRAHIIQFGVDGRPLSECPELLCNLTFGFATENLSVAGAIAQDLLQTPPVDRESEDLGGQYLEFAGATRNGLVQRNQVSPVYWLYPRHRQYTLLLNVSWRTPNLLELGELALQIEEHAAERLTLVGYRAVGDLVRDRMPRLLSHEVE